MSSISSPAAPAGLIERARRDPAFAAFWILRVGFVVLPFWMGLDKFVKMLQPDWPGYLASWIADLSPFSAQGTMYVVGAIEMVAGILVAIKPRYAAYVVAAWLAGIIIDLLTLSGFYDVALRDFGLLLAALCLALLASKYDRSLMHRHEAAELEPATH